MLGQYTKQQIHYLLYVLYQHYLKKGSVIWMYDVRMIQRQLHKGELCLQSTAEYITFMTDGLCMVWQSKSTSTI